MTNSAIRQYARQLIMQLPGRQMLFLTPVLLQILLVLTALHTALFLSEVELFRLETQLLPQLLNFLIIFFTASASLILLAVLRQQRTLAVFSDSTLIFEKPIFWPFIRMMIARQLFLLPWTIALQLGPALIVNAINQGNSLSLITGMGLGYLLVIAIYIRKVCAYSMANYLLFDHLSSGHKPNAFHIIKASAQIMNGHIWRYFRLELSFIGWYFLTFVTLGLMSIYVLPYHTATQVIFYQNRIQTLRQNQHHDKTC